MADRARSLHPVEIWFAKAGTVVRAADPDVERFHKDFANSRLRKLYRLDSKIGRQVICTGLDWRIAVQSKGVNGLAHRVARYNGVVKRDRR